MRMQSANHTDISMGVLAENTFSFEMNGIAAYTMMSGIASDKIGYPIRELCTNAWDAAQGNFEVHLPTRWDATFRVRDYGPGLSHELMTTVYTRFFASTKRETNEEAGGLGLGCKSPFAYLIQTDENGSKAASYTVRSFQDGMVRTYSMSLSTTGLPIMRLLDESETDEGSGLEVSFGVRREDIDAFQDRARSILWGFSPRPIITPTPNWVQEDKLASGAMWTKYRSGSVPWRGPHVRMGPVLYALDLSRITTLNFIQSNDCILFDARIGSLTVQTSRESLGYDDKTKATLTSLVALYEQGFVDDLQKKVDVATTYFEACKAFDEATQHLGYTLESRLRGKVFWKTLELQSDLAGKVMKLPDGWTVFDKFDRGTVYNRHVSRDVKIIIEHNPYRSAERFAKSGLVGKDLVWIRVKRAERDAFLASRHLTLDDVVILDDFKVEGPAVKRVKNVRRRRTMTIRAGDYSSVRRSDSVDPIDMNAGGIFIRKTGVKSYTKYQVAAGIHLTPGQLETLIDQLSKAGVLNEPIQILIPNSDDDLNDDWFYAGDYFDLRLRDLIDPSALSEVDLSQGLYNLPEPVRNNGQARWDLSKAPTDIVEHVARCKKVVETISNRSGHSNTHDYAMMALKTINGSKDLGIKQPKGSVDTLAVEWNFIKAKYPLLSLIREGFNQYNSEARKRVQVKLEYYFDLVANQK